MGERAQLEQRSVGPMEDDVEGVREREIFRSEILLAEARKVASIARLARVVRNKRPGAGIRGGPMEGAIVQGGSVHDALELERQRPAGAGAGVRQRLGS